MPKYMHFYTPTEQHMAAALNSERSDVKPNAILSGLLIKQVPAALGRACCTSLTCHDVVLRVTATKL